MGGLIKVFARVQGAVFSKSAPWPPEAKKNLQLFLDVMRLKGCKVQKVKI
jgi:hypothetical protein